MKYASLFWFTPYDLNTPLFSDYADKYRFLWMPRGTAAHYHADAVLEFPVGTMFAKTFALPYVPAGKSTGADLPEHLIETRLLVHATSGWVALPYAFEPNRSGSSRPLQVS